jgi:hypothetical protein
MQDESPIPPAEPPRERHPHEESTLPGWVPTAIGVVLVLMAALAVYTGLRYRNPTQANGIIRTRRPPRAMTGGGPPGEPEAGSSLVFPGDAANNTPGTAVAPDRSAIHLSARRGLILGVVPDDAMVFVNGLAIGEARQFNSMDKVYDFPAAGTYMVRIVAPGYKERQFMITAADGAAQEIARIDVKLQK